jgi:hypothetical protein
MPGPELGVIFAVIILIYAVVLFLLPFYVRRIQKEMIALNRTQSRVLAILESVVKNKKPQS